MRIDPDTVETNVQNTACDKDAYEYQTTRHFSFLVRVVRNVRLMNDLYTKVLRKLQGWESDSRLADFNPMFLRWLEELPPDLQLSFPANNSPPWLPSHFIGNMHSYYHLSIVMLHRPQLLACTSFDSNGQWRKHMDLCYSSAKNLCKLQEGILQVYSVTGLLCMQRGINFTIYAVLTCIMIHLVRSPAVSTETKADGLQVALTSPDPYFNMDAREFFTRHMRVLEQCISAWPMPETRAQIDALREAFSADLTRPFVLRPSFPYGSPGVNVRPTPPEEIHYQHPSQVSESSRDPQNASASYATQPVTPPFSASHGLTKQESPSALDYAQSDQLQMSNGAYEGASWNPTRIFK